MELDILNEIFSNTVGDLFRQNNKYNIFSSTLGPRNQFNINNNGKNQGMIKQQQQGGQPLISESTGQLQTQVKVQQPNQFAYNQMGQQQKQQQQQIGKSVGNLVNLQVGNSFSGTNGNLAGSNTVGNENKKLVSMSLNSSIQSSLLDQSGNQLNVSKDSISRGGVGASLNTSFNSKSGNTNESLIHSGQNVFRDSTNILRSSNGQFVNNFVGNGQQYPQNNQNFVNNTMQNNYSGSSNNNINFSQNQILQNNINSTHYNQQQLLQQNSAQQISSGQNYQHPINNNNNPKQNGTFINNYTKSTNSNSNENVTLLPDEWIRIEAPKKLEESMKRLGLDNQRITQRLIKEMNYDQLQSEKKRVKNELKLYDQAYENYFHVQPTRNQKEPMRPLYVYYKGLKQALVKNQNENKPTSNHPSQQQSVAISQGMNSFKQQSNLNIVSSSLPSSAQTSVQMGMNSHQSSHNDSFDIHNPNLISKQSANSLNTSLNGGNNGINPKILQVSNQNQRANSASRGDMRKNNKDLLDKNSYKDIMNIVQEQKENFNNIQGLSQPSLQHPSSQQSLQLNNNNNFMNNNMSNKESQKAVEQKINFMKRKRVQLREQLQVYQDDFYRTHNRKIKYHKDILPVENEYKEYKDIKKEIIKLEQMLQQQQQIA